MKLDDIFYIAKKAIKFNVEGITEDLYCRPLPLDELNDLIQASKEMTGFEFGAQLLAKCLVNKNGDAIKSVEDYRKVSSDCLTHYNKIIEEIRRINNLISNKETKELGKQ